MRTINLSNPRVTVNKVRDNLHNNNIKLTTGGGRYYLKNTFKIIQTLLNYNFKVYSTQSASNIEVREGKIYFNIVDINQNDCVSWLCYVDDEEIPIQNYNTSSCSGACTIVDTLDLYIRSYDGT